MKVLYKKMSETHCYYCGGIGVAIERDLSSDGDRDFVVCDTYPCFCNLVCFARTKEDLSSILDSIEFTFLRSVLAELEDELSNV